MGVELGKKLVNTGRDLRKNSTEVGRYLWKYLRRNQLEGFEVLRFWDNDVLTPHPWPWPVPRHGQAQPSPTRGEGIKQRFLTILFSW